MESEELAGPNSLEQKRIVVSEHRQIRRDEVTVGTIFEGFKSIEDLDSFVQKIGDYGYLNNTGHLEYPKLPSEVVRDFMKNKRFNGQLKDLRVAVLPPLGTTPPAKIFGRYKPFWFNPESESDEGLGLLATADMHSTGRGKVGEVSVHGRSFIQRNPKYYTKHGYFTSTLITTSENLQALSLLLRQSQQTAEDVEREAVKNPFSAGLPSLGKKR